MVRDSELFFRCVTIKLDNFHPIAQSGWYRVEKISGRLTDEAEGMRYVVDVGRAVALGRQEPLEEQPERHRIGRRDAERLLEMFAAALVDGAAAPERTAFELTRRGLDDDAVGSALPPPQTSALEQIVRRAAASPSAVAVVDSAGSSLDYARLVDAAIATVIMNGAGA